MENSDVTKEDVIDALSDVENTDALALVTAYYEAQNDEDGWKLSAQLKNSKVCAKLIYDAERYEDVVVWLDMVATKISDEEGPDSEAYEAFASDEELEELRIKATDKSLGGDEEITGDDYDDDE